MSRVGRKKFGEVKESQWIALASDIDAAFAEHLQLIREAVAGIENAKASTTDLKEKFDALLAALKGLGQ